MKKIILTLIGLIIIGIGSIFADTIVKNEYEHIERPYYKKYNDGCIELREVYDVSTNMPMCYILSFEYEDSQSIFRRSLQYFTDDFYGNSEMAKETALKYASVLETCHALEGMDDIILSFDNQNTLKSCPATKENGKTVYLKYGIVQKN
ncbi:MAG: hypothetical protein J5687_01240 [Treponema sp.]|nr:hypothetical protein [Treponema sp.]